MNEKIRNKNIRQSIEDRNAIVIKDVWEPPTLDDLDNIPSGDMPGDQIKIDESHIKKAQVIFPKLMNKALDIINNSPNQKVIISVHGGSGVGKSEIGVLLSYYFNEIGLGSYVLSGDNYPKRIPSYNDAERIRIFRASAINGLVDQNAYDVDIKEVLGQLMAEDRDADMSLVDQYPWLEIYQNAGREGLVKYLGSSDETDFQRINDILAKFKAGNSTIMLKRMGRELNDVWYERVDFSNTKVLIIEWTHGNNPNLLGVDYPILLNSTPEETLAHRRLRNRDGGLDSPFTAMVLSIEQEMLRSQAHKAKMIVSKNCEIISYETYEKRMMIK